MDDLLLFTPSKRVYIAKLEDLLKALLKTVLRYPKEMPAIQNRITVFGKYHIYKR